MKKYTMIKLLIPAIFAILGVFLGSYLNYKNSYNLFTKQKIYDNQRISFSKIMALKNPWIQAVQTNVEAKLLCEFYETRYIMFSKNIEDLNDSKKQNERALSLIKDISNYQMQTFETLGLIQTCFKVDKELQSAIDDIYNYNSIDVKTFPKKFKNQAELDLLLKKQFEVTKNFIENEYRKKLNKLIEILKQRLIETES